jgi:hypothetical protein
MGAIPIQGRSPLVLAVVPTSSPLHSTERDPAKFRSVSHTRGASSLFQATQSDQASVDLGRNCRPGGPFLPLWQPRSPLHMAHFVHFPRASFAELTSNESARLTRRKRRVGACARSVPSF